MSVSVKLEVFEGPLDLLLHLIQKHEIDIFDIPIHFITERFLEAIADLQELDLGAGGEFLVMAATLAHIKSRMLLPRPEASSEEDDDGEDPRADLVQQLVEYQRYKELAALLDERGTLGRDVFSRPGPRKQTPDGSAKMRSGALDLFQLLEAFEGVKRRAGIRQRLEITVARRTVAEEMQRVARSVAATGSVGFWSLVERDPSGVPAVTSIVGLFLALLELTRRGFVRVLQSSTDPGDLMIEAAVDDLVRALTAAE